MCPGQAVERLAPAPHKHRPKFSHLSTHFHMGQFISTLTTMPSQARHPCAVHNLNSCTNQPSAASSSFPQAQHQIKSLGQKTWLLLGQWSLPPSFWCGLGEFQGSVGEQKKIYTEPRGRCFEMDPGHGVCGLDSPRTCV